LSIIYEISCKKAARGERPSRSDQPLSGYYSLIGMMMAWNPLSKEGFMIAGIISDFKRR
jgi:hypothetical protein